MFDIDISSFLTQKGTHYRKTREDVGSGVFEETFEEIDSEIPCRRSPVGYNDIEIAKAAAVEVTDALYLQYGSGLRRGDEFEVGGVRFTIEVSRHPSTAGSYEKWLMKAKQESK